MVQTESYPRDAWQNYRKVQDEPWVIGDFVWTAIDYLGESGIGRWYYQGDVPGEHWERPLYPWHAAYCGDIDLIGQRKPISHYRSMLWHEDGEQLYMAVREPDGYNGQVKTTLWGTWPTFESWTWPGHEGKNIDVEVYSREPKISLYLNDRLIEEKETSECKAVFTLPYQPGTLRAEVSSPHPIREGQGGGSVSLQTADEAKAIRLSVSTPLHNREEKGVGLQADGQDLAFITIELTDEKGTLNPLAANELTATVSGSATLIGFGNADIKDCDRYTDNTHKAWKGHALLVVRSTGKKGKATITVQGKGLKPARVNVSFN